MSTRMTVSPRRRQHIAVTATLTAALLGLGACSSSGSSTTAKDTGSTAAASTQSTSGGHGSEGGGGGGIDCAAAKAAASRLIVPIQLVAALKTPEQFQELADKGTVSSLKFDVDQALTDLKTMHQLDDFDQQPFGSPKEGIDKYEGAFEAVKKLSANGAPTQAQIDDFQTKDVGSTADFLKGQQSISAALSTECH